jgi:hypothetical protein
MSFMMGSVKGTLRDESLQKRFCKQVTIRPPSSRMPMIIAGIGKIVGFWGRSGLGLDQIGVFIANPT